MEYAWSSLPRFLAKDRPKVLEPGVILRESGELSDTPAGWRRYIDYLALLDEEDQRRRDDRYGRLSRGWLIGSDEFRDQMRQQYAAVGGKERNLALAGADRASHREIRALAWEDTLVTLAAAAKVDLTKLPAKRSAPEKVLLAAVMKQATSVSNGWLADRLQIGLAATVSQYVRRLRLAGGDRTPQFQRLLSKVQSWASPDLTDTRSGIKGKGSR